MRRLKACRLELPMRVKMFALPVRVEVWPLEARSGSVLPAREAAKSSRRMEECDSLRLALSAVAAGRWADSARSVTGRGEFEKRRIWKSKFLRVFRQVHAFVLRVRETQAFWVGRQAICISSRP